MYGKLTPKANIQQIKKNVSNAVKQISNTETGYQGIQSNILQGCLNLLGDSQLISSRMGFCGYTNK
jgi:hypothetical protein